MENKESKEIKEKIRETEYMLNKLKYDLILANESEEKKLINNLPPNFAIYQQISGYDDYCFGLYYKDKRLLSCNEDNNDHKSKLFLAKKANEYWEFASIVLESQKNNGTI